MRLVLACRFGFSCRAVFSAKSTSIYKPGTTAKRALLCGVQDKGVWMASQFINGYFSLWNMYTATYGGMLLWGTSLPKFIDMISVLRVELGPSCIVPVHLEPAPCLYVKTPFGLWSSPPFTILELPSSNLNCKSPFTTGSSSTVIPFYRKCTPLYMGVYFHVRGFYQTIDSE